MKPYRMKAEPSWRERERALMWGAPLALFPALAFAPVTISLFLEPAFTHARWLGCALVPLMGWSVASGLVRLASCFRSDFDVVTLFAGGAAIVFVVIAMSEGAILANVVANL